VLPFRSKRGDSQIYIRPATREDLDALFALDRACFRPGIAYSKTELRYFLFHLRSISVVAEDESGIAGFAVVEFVLEEGRRIGHIVTIDVAPSHRRRGVGRLLMDALLGFCRQAGALSLRLEVAVDNEGAITFYKLMGFAETGRIRGYYMGKLDALTMRLVPRADAPFAPSR
jgi:ribosomal-protein-alanine N-acetyltransferase